MMNMYARTQRPRECVLPPWVIRPYSRAGPLNFFEGACPWSGAMDDLEEAMQDMNREFRVMESRLNNIFCGHGDQQSMWELRPKVVGEGDKKRYELQVNMGSTFKPEDLKIVAKDGMMSIEAKKLRESPDGNHRVYQEVTRKFSLPKDVDVKEVKSVLSPEGVLTIEAPMSQKAIQAQEPKPIPIEHK